MAEFYKNKGIQRFYRLIILLIILMFFGEPYGVTLIGSAYRYIFAALIVVSLLFFVVTVQKIWLDPLDRFPLLVTKISWGLLLLSIPFWDTMLNVYSYVGISVAFILYLHDFRFTNKLLVWLVFLSFVLTAFEYFTQHFLFVNVVHDKVMDEELFGGSLGVFRAKGIFFGPLSAGVFVVMAFFLNNQNIWLLLAALLVCFFANSRMGMLILSIPLLILLLKNRKPIYLFGVLVVVGISIALILKYAPHVLASIERISMVGDLESNEDRIFFWKTGIELFLRYPLYYIVFGNNGYYNSLYDNNPESGWICLLTDNGLVGFFFYLIPIVYCFYKFLQRRSYYNFVITGLLFMVNFLLTAHLSGTGNLMYWLVMFELYNRAKYGYGKLDSPNIPRLGISGGPHSILRNKINA